MAEYTYADMMRMQNDAVKRVEEMQKRARDVSGVGNSQKARQPEQSVEIKTKPTHIPMPPDYLDKLKKFAQNGPDENMRENSQTLQTLKLPEIDSDRSLILSLLLLLAEENADETLLLALLYMLS